MKKVHHAKLLQKAPIAYAYHKIILDDNGKPCDYVFLDVNQEFERQTGLNRDDVINKSVITVLPEIVNDDFDWIRLYGEVALNGVEKQFEQYSQPLDRFYKIYAFSPEKQFFTTLFIDLTEEKKQRLQLQNFFEVNLGLLCIADMQGNFVKLNKEWESVLGFPIEELENSKFLDLVHPEDLDATLEAVSKLQSQEDVTNFTNRYQCKDGSYRYIDWRSKPEGNLIYAAARDVTEEVLWQERLEHSRKAVANKLKSILHPEGDISDLSLEDILDIDFFQSMMDKFYSLTGFGIAIIDNTGKVLVKTGWQDICVKFHRNHPQTNRRCIESDTILNTDLKAGEVRKYRCKNNMWDIVTPITYGDRRLGGIYLGQFFLDSDEVDYEFFREQARKYDFDEEAYMKALDSVPRWSEADVNMVVEFYRQMAIQISENNIGNIKLAKTVTERDRLLSSLDESEKRFLDILYASEDAILLIQDNTFIDCNKATAKMLRYTSRSDFLQQHPSKLSPEFQPDGQDSVSKADEMMSKAFSDGFNRFEWIHTRANGEDFPVEVSLTPISHKGKQMLHCVWRDITESKLDQKMRIESEERFRSIIKKSADAIFFHDMEGNLILVNDNSCKSLGYTEEELLKLKVQDIDPTAIEFDFINDHWPQIPIGEAMLIEGKHTRKDGSVFPVEVNLTKILYDDQEHLIAAARDISERKVAEEKLKESEERFRTIIEKSADSMIIHDLEGNIIAVNEKTSEFLGYSQEELLQMNAVDIDLDIDLKDLRKHWKELSVGVDVLLESYHTRKDGSRFPVEISLNKILINREERIIGFIRDITERNKAKEAIEKKNRFQKMLTDISSSLINVDEMNFDSKVNSLLEVSADYFHIDRCYLVSISEDEKILTKTHEWSREGIKQRINEDNSLSVDTLPWWRERLNLNSTIVISDVDELPPKAEHEKSILKESNVKSLAIVPLFIGGKTKGYLGLETVKEKILWEQEHVRSLEVLSNIISNTYSRLESEKKLRQSEEKFRRITNNMSDVVFTTDIDLNTIFVSPSIERMTGDTPEIHTPKTMQEKFPPSSLIKIQKMMTEELAKENDPDVDPNRSRVVEVEHYKADGSIIDVSMNVCYIRDDIGNIIGYQGIMRDVTESKLAEEALKTSEENFRNFFQTMEDFIVIGNREGRIEYSNPAVSERLDYSSEELSKMCILDLHSSDHRSEAEVLFSDILLEKRNNCPLPLATKKGKLIPVETKVWLGKWNGKESVFAISKNLTKEQEALQKFNKIFDKNPALMAISTIPDQVITEVNQSFLNTLSFTYEEVIGKKTSNLNIIINDELQQAAAKELQEKGHIHNVQLRLRNRTGGILHGLFSGEVIENQGKKTFLTVMINITDRIKAEEALRSSEAKFRTYIQSAPVGIFITDESGRYIEVNDEACKMTDYTREELLSLAVSDLVHPDAPPATMESFAELQQKGFVETEIVMRKKNGFPFPASLRAVKLPDNRSMGFCVDITERKRAEEEIRLKSLVLDQIEDLVTITDLEGTITFVNQAEIDTLQRPREELIGKNTQIYGEDPDEGAKQKDIVEMTLRDGSARFEVVNFATNGRRFVLDCRTQVVFDENKKPIALCGISTDITYRKLFEKKLKESEERFRKLSNLTFEGIMIHKDGLILDANESLVELLGFKRNDIIGKDSITEFVLPKYHDLIKKNLAISYTEPYEIEILTKDGSYIPVEIIGKNFEENGELFRVAAIRDIREKKAAEEERKKLEAQLMQAQKMETIGTLAGGVAHDFNNLLTPIMGYAEMALLDVEPQSMIYNELLQIRKGAEKARDLVKQLLVFSRKFENQGKRISLNREMQDAHRLIRAAIPSTIQISLDLPKDEIFISAVAGQINQIVMNLATNSFHAMPKGGEIKISLETAELPKSFESFIKDFSPGRYAKLTISDDGEGMSGEVVARLFEPFFTTKEQGKGTGLGLSVVHGIISALKGAIFVDSKIGIGTTFTIYLPENKETSLDIAPKKGEIQKGKGRIMVVDDVEENIEIFKALLERLSYEVDVYKDPKEAINKFKSNPKKFDIILSDITMPGMTGIMLAKLAKEISPTTPVILMTGYSDEKTTQLLEEKIIDDYLQKPINLAKLSDSIRRNLKGK